MKIISQTDKNIDIIFTYENPVSVSSTIFLLRSTTAPTTILLP